jgi:hypothetical protein
MQSSGLGQPGETEPRSSPRALCPGPTESRQTFVQTRLPRKLCAGRNLDYHRIIPRKLPIVDFDQWRGA